MTTSRYDEIMKTKPYLPFHMGYLTEAMVKKAEEELGETEEAKARMIPELRKMVENEPNLVCPKDDNYLLQYLRARKFNVKKAFTVFQNYHRVKTNNPDLYDMFDEELVRKCVYAGIFTYLPYRDEDGCAICIIQMGKWDTDVISIKEGMTCLPVAILFGIEDMATQVCGMHIILDVGGFSIKHAGCLTPRYMTLLSKALRNHLPVRFKGIHLFNENAIFGFFWSVFRLFLSEKIRNRVHFHGHSQKHLHKAIPKAILPTEFGGDSSELLSSDWFAREFETNFFEKYKELVTYGYRK